MKLFDKELKEIDENNLRKMEADPMNFESLQIEYKVKFDGNAGELRRDVVQFANGFEDGYILFGISDDPITIVGIEKKEVDILKTVLNDVLTKKIEPILSPFPQFHAVPLASGNYVFIIKIFPKEHGIYGIRQSDDMNNRNYYRYEFYTRMDGSKHRMNIEEIVNLIESKSKGEKKQLEVSIHGVAIMPTIDDDVYISIKAVNKSVRPVIINSYGIDIPKKGKVIIFTPTILQQKYFMINTRLPYKLDDGESCQAFLSRKDLKEMMIREGWDYPIEARAIFYTNDGKFYSEIIEIQEIE
ncbi:MAG: ATP-binding protein [Candidatus Helarchaeota archaeon]